MHFLSFRWQASVSICKLFAVCITPSLTSSCESSPVNVERCILPSCTLGYTVQPLVNSRTNAYGWNELAYKRNTGSTFSPIATPSSVSDNTGSPFAFWDRPRPSKSTKLWFNLPHQSSDGRRWSHQSHIVRRLNHQYSMSSRSEKQTMNIYCWQSRNAP